MILIAAMGPDRVIGAGDGMPWSVPAEYARFLDRIRDQTVLMGRRSWEIFGGDLTSAENVVVSRSPARVGGAHACGSMEAAVALARSFGRKVFSAGGASVYRQTMPLADAMELSVIAGEWEGDTYFPEFDPAVWRVASREPGDGFEVLHYRRR